jgi:hypothetical protein
MDRAGQHREARFSSAIGAPPFHRVPGSAGRQVHYRDARGRAVDDGLLRDMEGRDQVDLDVRLPVVDRDRVEMADGGDDAGVVHHNVETVG